MIKSFKCKHTENLFNRIRAKIIPTNIQKTAIRKLWMLNAATNINDLRTLPANRLEKLKNSKNQYSIRINKQWSLCFKWTKDNAYNVEIIDYH